MNNATIHGSHGDFTVDASGLPTGPVPDAYRDIRKVNLAEYRTWDATLPTAMQTPNDVDILSAGYWIAAGYEPPDMKFRGKLESGGI